jgi:CRISPR-associated protein Csm5
MTNAVLEIITPVHIGSGDTLVKDLEYILEGKQLHEINMDALCNAIGAEHVSQWAADVSAGNNLQQLLNRYTPGKKPIDFAQQTLSVSKQTADIAQYRPHMRTLGRPYIPGTSLKGAIRTMIHAPIAREMLNSQKDTIPESWYGYMKRGHYGEKFNFTDKHFKEHIFGKSANEDALRFLQVGDLHFETGETEAREALVLNHGAQGWDYKKNTSMLYECLKPGLRKSFRLSWKPEVPELNKGRNLQKLGDSMFNSYGQNLHLIMGRVHEQTGFILDKEIRNVKAQIDESEHYDRSEMLENLLELLKELKLKHTRLNDKNGFMIRLGAHIGWNFTTGSFAFTKINNLNRTIFDHLSVNIQKKDYGDTYALFPKSRKVLSGNMLGGFVAIHLLP